MYYRKQRNNAVKRINVGICLYPSKLEVLEKFRGEFSRSGFIETILLDYFKALDEIRATENNG